MASLVLKIRRLGFTLVELLVVIAIIGILAGIMYPAIRRVQESSRRAHCMSNLHQMGKFLTLYADSHRGKYPESLKDMGLYVRGQETEILVCPSMARHASPATGIEGLTATNTSYNYKSGLNDMMPATKLLMCDRNGNTDAAPGAWGGNHQGKGGHILCIGENVEWVSESDMTDEKWNKYFTEPWTTNMWAEPKLGR